MRLKLSAAACKTAVNHTPPGSKICQQNKVVIATKRAEINCNFCGEILQDCVFIYSFFVLYLNLVSLHSSKFIPKHSLVLQFEPLTTSTPTIFTSTKPPVSCFYQITFDFKSDSSRFFKNKCVKIWYGKRILVQIFRRSKKLQCYQQETLKRKISKLKTAGPTKICGKRSYGYFLR